MTHSKRSRVVSVDMNHVYQSRTPHSVNSQRVMIRELSCVPDELVKHSRITMSRLRI